MNIHSPVSFFMTKQVISVEPTAPLNVIRDLFVMHDFHHLPVVDDNEGIIGLISKSDFERFQGGSFYVSEDRFLQETRLKSTQARDIMTKGLAKISPEDRLDVALDIFCLNRFHALPVVDRDNKLIGILTPYDILKALQGEKITLKNYEIV